MTATARTADPGQGDALLQNGDVSYAIPLDLDLSPGTGVGGAPALVYHSSTVDVHPVIQATLASDNSLALPPVLRAILTWDGVAQPEQVFSTTGFAAGQDLTLAVQPTAAVKTGRHTWSLQVTADYPTPAADVVKKASGGTFVVSLDGRGLAAPGDGRLVHLWDVDKGVPTRTIRVSIGTVFDIRFSPDGRRLASTGGDFRVKVWDVETGQELLSFAPFRSDGSGVAFSPDGRWLAASSEDGTLKLWDANVGGEAFPDVERRPVQR